MIEIEKDVADIILDILVNQGLDPLRDVFVVHEVEKGYAVDFARDVTPTAILHGLRVHHRGDSLYIDLVGGSQIRFSVSRPSI